MCTQRERASVLAEPVDGIHELPFRDLRSGPIADLLKDPARREVVRGIDDLARGW